MSTAECAARLGVPEYVIAEYEAGELRIDARTLFRLVTLLGVHARYFYDGMPATAARPDRARAG